MSAAQLSFDREYKNSDRLWNTRGLQPKRSVLMLPSREALDVKLLLHKGIIDATTRQWWVEIDPSIATSLRSLASELGLPKVTVVQQRLEDFMPPEPLDYINADMMCSFTPELALWFERVEPILTPGATIVVNYLPDHRRGNFLDWFAEQLCHSDLPIMQDLHIKVDAFRDLLDAHGEGNLIPRVMFCCALRNHHFDWFSGQSYRDVRRNMGSFRVDNMRDHPNSPWPSFSSLYKEFSDQHQPKGTVKEAERTKLGLVEIQDKLLQGYNLRLDMDTETEEWLLIVPATNATVQRFQKLSEVCRSFNL